MKNPRVFISHSSADKPIARMLAEKLKPSGVHSWIDEREIFVGDTILEELGRGLSLADAVVFLISDRALRSNWVRREVEYAEHCQIADQRITILPFIIDDTEIDKLPWFLRLRKASRISSDAQGVAVAAQEILANLEKRHAILKRPSREPKPAALNPQLAQLIAGIEPGDWPRAQRTALQIVTATDVSGHNSLFDSLIASINSFDDDQRRGALLVVESVAQLAPWLVTRDLIVEFANSEDFSLQSSAASICFDFSRLAPDRVPTDVVISLARHDRDWYVTTPATGALKMMAKWRPAILELFYGWLVSDNGNEREHGAAALADIAEREPEILDLPRLSYALKRLRKLSDLTAVAYIQKARKQARKAADTYPFRYGRF